jgi:hypothetical protein
MCMDTATPSSPLLETTKVVGGLLGRPPAPKVSIAASSGDFLDSLCVVRTISPEPQWLDDFPRGLVGSQSSDGAVAVVVRVRIRQPATNARTAAVTLTPCERGQGGLTPIYESNLGCRPIPRDTFM